MEKIKVRFPYILIGWYKGGKRGYRPLIIEAVQELPYNLNLQKNIEKVIEIF